MSITNIRWANVDQKPGESPIDCTLPNGLPFTASPVDPEEQGRVLYAALIAGDHGAIADYVPPPEPEPVELPEPQASQEQMRSALLALGMTEEQVENLITVAKSM